MTDYYMQYVANEAAYKCALGVLGQEIHDSHIKELTFPMFRNYGLVLHDLVYVLEHRKPPIDGILSVVAKSDSVIGKLVIKHR